jgi:beta-glucosidase-like glycosyl hydrolase
MRAAAGTHPRSPEDDRTGDDRTGDDRTGDDRVGGVDPAGLTLEQKVSLLSGESLWTTKAVPEAGVPALVLADGPHGVRLRTGKPDEVGLGAGEPATCFPPAVAIGSSWDPEAAELLGAAVGREARALGRWAGATSSTTPRTRCCPACSAPPTSTACRRRGPARV